MSIKKCQPCGKREKATCRECRGIEWRKSGPVNRQTKQGNQMHIQEFNSNPIQNSQAVQASRQHKR